ncbi:MAG: tetraacyldisaccharide 4'-kinase [Rhizobiaceae bacterium]
MPAPSFWWRRAGWQAAALSPLASIYAAVAASRLRNAPREKVGIPVLCVGNFTVGGSGKTPVTIALAGAAKAMGLKPGILSRGYGGSVKTPRIVEPGRDTARDVGDEPLLLAEAAPVAVSADRASGARLLAARGCDLVIMDDGFQSAHIHMDFALIVTDARYGIGNGRVLPAGPLRAPVADQIRFASALLVMGEGNAADDLVATAQRLPFYRARVRPREKLDGRRFLAFAGIGHPEKFFDTVKAAGGEVVETRSFPDHHVFAQAELSQLAKTAKARDLELVTTAKDAVRIGRETFAALLPGSAFILDIEAVFDEPETPRHIIEATLSAARGM